MEAIILDGFALSNVPKSLGKAGCAEYLQTSQIQSPTQMSLDSGGLFGATASAYSREVMG